MSKSNTFGQLDEGQASPPPPPPLPEGSTRDASKSTDVNFKPKVKNTPEEWFHQPKTSITTSNPIGSYIFYGTLMDPTMIRQLLNLNELPKLRPGRITGYACKLWGPYPALVDGVEDSVVEGAVYDVQTTEDVKKLAFYETNNYTIKHCSITYTDEQEPASVSGYAFVFSGNPRDLSEGTFDLKSWLKRMGRAGAI